MIVKNIIKLILSGCVLFFINGCSDKQETNKEESKIVNTQEIKVTENAVKKQTSTKKKSKDGGKFYYGYNETDKIEDDEIKSYTPVDAYRRIKSPYERVQISLLANKLSKKFIIRCSACHDDYANGIIGPSLLDRDGDFIYKRLIAYKTGSKTNVLMKELVGRMKDSELKALANEIAEFNKKVQKLQAGEKVE